MNKKLLLAFGAVAAAVVLVGVAFVLTQKSSVTPGTPSSVATDDQSGGLKSLKNLLTSGQSQMCTFKDLVEDADYEGTVYISNGKMRGDFNSSSNGQTFRTHMIVKDNTSYIWTDEQAGGFMMEFNIGEVQEQIDSSSNDTPKTVDINKTIDYKCSGWSEDSSMFAPPSDIEFQDLSKMLAPSGIQTGGQDLQNQCSACDSLTGDSKAQCLAALKCN